MERIPVTDAIIYAVARLAHDAQTERRDPSHSDIEFQINKAGLTKADPNKEGSPVGKAKRVRIILSWALENNPDACEKFASGLISHIKACGDFRKTAPNFVGEEAIENLSSSLKELGVFLSRVEQ